MHLLIEIKIVELHSRQDSKQINSKWFKANTTFQNKPCFEFLSYELSVIPSFKISVTL